MKMKDSQSHSLKEEGNNYFKQGDVDNALSCYTKSLSLGDMKDSDRAVIYKNLAACHLKLNDYEKAIEDATSCECTLDIF